MEQYYYLRIKKDYAGAIIQDLQKLDAVELLDATNNTIPEWQQKEVLQRLQALNDNPENAIDWETATGMIKQWTK